jgi:regulatory protein
VVITKIDRQKKNPARFSLYLDDEYAIGIHKEVLLKFGLRVRDRISEKTLEELKHAEETRAARESALRLLSYRARSTKELRERLKKKRYSPEAINEVLISLERSGLINDFEFAKAFVHDRLLRKPMGKGLLVQELRKKGIKKETIEDVLAEAYRNDAEDTYACELAAKRMKRAAASFGRLDPLKRRKRLADYLARRGFDWETVSRALERVLGEATRQPTQEE